MDLLNKWRRRTFGAAAGAVIAPVAIVGAALAVGFGGGGLGGIGSLSQAFEGPALPAVAPLSQRRSADDAGRLLARIRRDAPGPGADGTSDAAAPPAAGPAPTGTTTPTDPGGTAPPRTGVIDPIGGTPPAPSSPPAAPSPTAPTPAPTQPPSAIGQVGDTVTGITDRVPIVGEPASDLIDALVDALP